MRAPDTTVERATAQTEIKAWHSYWACQEQVIRAQQDQVQTLSAENESLKSQFSKKITEYDLLADDIISIIDEKHQLFNQYKREKTEKEIGELILEQYREEIKTWAANSELAFQGLSDLMDERDVEISNLMRQKMYYEHSIAAGEGIAADLHEQLQRKNKELAAQRVENARLWEERNESIDGYLFNRSQILNLQHPSDKRGQGDVAARASQSRGQASVPTASKSPNRGRKPMNRRNRKSQRRRHSLKA